MYFIWELVKLVILDQEKVKCFCEILCTLTDGFIILLLRIAKTEKRPGCLLISLLLKVVFQM